MKKSNDRVAHEVFRERLGKIVMWILTIGGLLVGIAGVIVGLK